MQATIELDPMVGGSVSIAEFAKRMHRVMNEDRPEMEVVPTDYDLIAQYLLLYSFFLRGLKTFPLQVEAA